MASISYTSFKPKVMKSPSLYPQPEKSNEQRLMLWGIKCWIKAVDSILDPAFPWR